MRIIAGKCKGRKLNSPVSGAIRPTLDRMKETLFNLIQNQIGQAECLDLFSGTGTLGIEALSRGAQHCIFVDSAKAAITLTQKNIAVCRLETQAKVLHLDALKALTHIATNHHRFHLIFLDPPYFFPQLGQILFEIDRLNLLHNDGLIIVEHDRTHNFNDVQVDFSLKKQKRYKKVAISIYEHPQKESQ